jgi:hypothetical protein
MSNFLKLNGKLRSQEFAEWKNGSAFESGKAGGRGRRETFLGCSGCFQFVQQVLQLLKRHTSLVSLDIDVSRSVTVPTGEQNAHGRRPQRNAIAGTATGSISTKITNVLLSRREKNHPDQHSP